jgi:hypothetical protein
MRIFLLLIPLGLAACATTNVNEPSLARRPAEAIDPRVPIPSNPVPGPVDGALASRLGALVAEGKAGAAEFEGEVGRAQALAAAAGPSQSESWVLAQQALSGLEAARARTTRALSDIDDLAAGRIQSGGLSAGDQTAIETASNELRAASERQTAVLEEIAARLAR